MAKFKSYSIGPVSGAALTITEARAIAERRAAAVLAALNEGPAVVVPPLPCDWTAILVTPSLTSKAGDWELIGFRPGLDRRVPLMLYSSTKEGAVYTAIRTIAHDTITADTDAATLDTLVAWAAGILDEGQAVTERADWTRQVRQLKAHRGA